MGVLFFLLLMLFHKQINKFLVDKEDFFVGEKRLWDKRYGSAAPIPKKNETRCREIFESIFQRPFPSVRPDFLKRANGYALELDGYNRDLKLGFEYQGSQHYGFNTRFHRSEKDYQDQVVRDQAKRDLCQKAGVTLIEISYKVPYQKLDSYIREQLRNRKLL
jgi:hypothetical protein